MTVVMKKQCLQTSCGLMFPINLINSTYINKPPFLQLCNADYARYSSRHLHQCISEHKYLAIGKLIQKHQLTQSALEDKQFSNLKKCRLKFDCLIFEVLFIKELSPLLNTQINRKTQFVPNFLCDSLHAIILYYIYFSTFQNF